MANKYPQEYLSALISQEYWEEILPGFRELMGEKKLERIPELIDQISQATKHQPIPIEKLKEKKIENIGFVFETTMEQKDIQNVFQELLETYFTHHKIHIFYLDQFDSTELLLKNSWDLQTNHLFLMGAGCTKIILDTKDRISNLNGKLFVKEIAQMNFTLIPLYHPEFMALNINLKKIVWEILPETLKQIQSAAFTSP